MNSARRSTFYNSNNIQNSLTSFDESSPYTNGSLNTASQLSFGELSNQNSPLIDDKYLLFYQSSSGFKPRNRQQTQLNRNLSHQTLMRNNVKDMALVINQNNERKQRQNELSNVVNQVYPGSGKLTKTKQFNQYSSLTQIILPEQSIRSKKSKTITNSDSKSYLLDKSEYLSIRNQKPKLSFQEQFSSNNSSCMIKLPAININSNSDEKRKEQRLSITKPSLIKTKEESAIRIEDNSPSQDTNQKKSETLIQKIQPESNQIATPQRVIVQKKEINYSEKFAICIQHFPSQFKKNVEKNEELRLKLEYFRIEDIKSSSEQIELLSKFLVKCLKALEIKSQEQLSNLNGSWGGAFDSQMNNLDSNITQKQQKKKMLINCAIKQLRLSETLLKDICETVFEILQKFEIPSSLFNTCRKIITDEWKSQLKCQTFADQIGGYRNIVPIIAELENELIAAFKFTKFEQEQLELYDHQKLADILKELIDQYTKNEPAQNTQNKDQSSYRTHKQQSKPMLGDYIKTIKNVFSNRSKTNSLKENSPFFLMKYSVWNTLINSSESKYFPIDQKLNILSIFEKLRNQYVFMDYWKEDVCTQQRMNILFNTISSRQNIMQQLGPYFTSNEKVFCKAILQFVIGQISPETFFNTIKEFFDQNSMNPYFLTMLNTAVFDALNINSFITPKINSALLQHKFFFVNEIENQTLYLKQDFINENYIQLDKNSEDIGIEQTLRTILKQILSTSDKQQEKKSTMKSKNPSDGQINSSDKINTMIKFLLTIILDSNIYSVFDIQEIFILNDVQNTYQLKQNISQELKRVLYQQKLSLEQVFTMTKYLNNTALSLLS